MLGDDQSQVVTRMDAIGYLDRFKERRKFQNTHNRKFNFMGLCVACVQRSWVK